MIPSFIVMEINYMPSQKYLMYISQNYSYAMLRPIQAEILSRGGSVKWFLEGKGVSSSYLHENEERLPTVEEVNQWKPDFILTPGNLLPNFISGIKVAVFHGFNSGKRGDDAHFKIRQCFDLYCTQGPNTTDRFLALSEQYKTFTVKETGWATLDPLFSVNDINPYLSDLNDKRATILFCSTFSKETSYAEELLIDIEKLSLTSNYRILVQFHSKMSVVTINKYKAIQNENLQFIETDNVIPLLKAADIMLCDTSSVMIMFLLQKKPVIAYKNKTTNKGFIHIDNMSNIELVIDNALKPSNELLNNIEKYCDQTHPYTDGNSSSRVIDACEELNETDINNLKKKPLNLIRQLKLRRSLNYWKL